MQKIILDVDTGIDDALAIILATRLKNFDILGITTVAGNVRIEDSINNTLKVLELMGRVEIPVFRGASKPFAGDFKFGYVFHGEDGLANTGLPEPRIKVQNEQALDFIIRTIKKNPGQITIVATAPLTNIAKAFKKEPDIIELIKELYIMGGAVNVKGNETKYAEFNFYNDPLAAGIILGSGAKIKIVPLDVTNKTIIKQERLVDFGNTEVANFVKNIISNWYQFFGTKNNRRFELYDPLTVGALVEGFLHFKEARVKIIDSGDKKGMVVKDRLGSPLEYAYEVEVENFIKYFIDKINK